MFTNKKKIALVGTGMVGMSFAYAALNQNLCDELVLIDINEQRVLRISYVEMESDKMNYCRLRHP